MRISVTSWKTRLVWMALLATCLLATEAPLMLRAFALFQQQSSENCGKTWSKPPLAFALLMKLTVPCSLFLQRISSSPFGCIVNGASLLTMNMSLMKQLMISQMNETTYFWNYSGFCHEYHDPYYFLYAPIMVLTVALMFGFYAVLYYKGRKQGGPQVNAGENIATEEVKVYFL